MARRKSEGLVIAVVPYWYVELCVPSLQVMVKPLPGQPILIRNNKATALFITEIPPSRIDALKPWRVSRGQAFP